MGVTGVVYLDSCLVIYLIEEHPSFGPLIRQAIDANAEMQFCISPLVELECLVVPLRQYNQVLINRYEMFFQDYVRLEINPDIYRRAAELRARQSLKTPDALHLATAQYHGCTEFWTNDDRLSAFDRHFVVNLLA